MACDNAGTELTDHTIGRSAFSLHALRSMVFYARDAHGGQDVASGRRLAGWGRFGDP